MEDFTPNQMNIRNVELGRVVLFVFVAGLLFGLIIGGGIGLSIGLGAVR